MWKIYAKDRAMKLKQGQKPANEMAEYKAGDRDERPWGEYIVMNAGLNGKGEEFCEKKITVLPGRILSLQSHERRRETWIVEQGVLTIVLDGERMDLHAGEKASIPPRAIHCMANPGKIPCIVRERQEGVCREEDIRRYIDAYGRETEASALPAVRESIAAYRLILDGLSKQAA
jgi:mannose-6-phosphate isomerase-like protein (cupin superfamily)